MAVEEGFGSAIAVKVWDSSAISMTVKEGDGSAVPMAVVKQETKITKIVTITESALNLTSLEDPKACKNHPLMTGGRQPHPRMVTIHSTNFTSFTFKFVSQTDANDALSLKGLGREGGCTNFHKKARRCHSIERTVKSSSVAYQKYYPN